MADSFLLLLFTLVVVFMVAIVLSLLLEWALGKVEQRNKR